MADATIDKVQIEIEAKASKANDVLDQLAKNLDNVKRALTGFDTSALERIQKSLDSIESKAQAVSKTNVTPNIDTSKICTSERKISNSLENIQDKFARLSNLANAAMGGDTSALTSFKRQATSLQGDLDVLQGKLQRLGETRPLSQAWQDTIRQEKEVEDRLSNLKAKMNDVMSGKTTMSGNAFQKLQEDIKSAEQARERISETQRLLKASGQQYGGPDPFQKYRDGALAAQKDLDALIAKIDKLKNEKEGPKLDFSKIKSGIQSAIGAISDFNKKLLSTGGSAIKGAISGIGKAFDGLKAGVAKVKDGFGGLHKFMDKGFMKILKYGFGVRSIYVGFRRLRKAVVESFGELQKSGAMWETTKSNVESLKTALATLKFQFGAAFEPIFNAVAPALESFINMLIRAFNTLSAFIAKITGRSTYSKVESVTLAAAKNTGAAAKNAKELNKQLQKFDELNNLTTNNSGGGGGGGGGGGDGDSATYTEANVEDALGDFGKKLAEAIKAGDWELVGRTISNGITDALNNIDWEKNKEKAKVFGTNLGNFINGLINPELFSALGTTIGEAINTALEFGKAVAETIKWDNLGDSIAAGINAFVATNPLALIVENFNLWANGILEALIHAVRGTNWSAIAQNIADAIGNIKAGEIMWNVGTLVGELIHAFYTLVSNKKMWTNLGDMIADGVNGFLAGMNATNGWAYLGKSVSSSFSGFINFVTSAIEGVHWEEVGNAIATFISNIDWKEVVFDLAELAIALGNAIVDFIDGLTIGEGNAGGIAITLAGVALAIGSIGSFGFAAGVGGASVLGAMLGVVKATLAGVLLGLGVNSVVEYATGKSIGGLISQWLCDKGIISAEANGEYQANDKLSLTQQIADIKLSAEEGTLHDALKLMWNDLEDTIFVNVVLKKLGFNSMEDFVNSTMPRSDMANSASQIAQDTLNVAVGVQLKKDGWNDIAEFVNKNSKNQHVKSFVNLMKGKGEGTGNQDAWSSISDYVNKLSKNKTDVSSAVNLKQGKANKKDWTSIAGFVNDVSESNNVNANVGLEKATTTTGKGKNKKTTAAWDNVADWVKKNSDKEYVEASVGLTKNNSQSKELWSSVADWVKKKSKSERVNASVGLTKKDSKSKDLWESVGAWTNSHAGSKKVNAEVGLAKDWPQKSVGGWVWDNGKPLGFEAPIGLGKSGWSTVKQFLENNFEKSIQNGTGVREVKATELAEGGSFFGGAWHDIPQFANGTLNALKHGTIFAAGEAGPEVVGHINGRTEILNRSQIASTMYTAITRGMMQFRNAQMVTPQMLGFAGNIADGIATGISSTNNDSLLMEQNRLLAEQNRWLQQIANKDVTISSKDVYNATMREAQNYNNRTGNSPFLF